ncbi:hypothetical protein, partial [Nonomuraea sp. LPB2021202275-12-8]|uniref:hypothetical protein n=1 Tax=Nonomuraea sp. LPB2021202275-12-8 TaxID=3120159 RepID=UPI00300C87E7
MRRKTTRGERPRSTLGVPSVWPLSSVPPFSITDGTLSRDGTFPMGVSLLAGHDSMSAAVENVKRMLRPTAVLAEGLNKGS